MTNVELYEALRGPVGEQAARMIAEVAPPARDLALKRDIEALRGEMRAEILALEARIYARLFVMFAPLWAGVFALVVTVMLKF